MNNSPTSSFPEDEYRQYELGLHLLADRYHFVSKIQDGSFGKVSLALDSHSNSKVSIKAISKVNESSSKSSREIAYNEIRILEMLNTTASSKLDFDNSSVCKLLDSFEISNYVILVLEYCSKGDLYDLIHERTMTISEILRLAKQLYNAVGFSHSMNIFHRDIKPENILIDEHDNFKLCDWGLATTIRENDEFNVGTEKYMAPECFLTNASGQYIVSKYDCKYSDYWLFGVTLITSIFGTSPFKPTKKSSSKDSSESIQSDSNFRNFVNYNNPHVLYDIYSSMNTNCFQLFMSLLKVGNDEDDLATFSSKARSRNLSKFIRDLESNWIYGFTIDDEDKFYDINSKESDEAVFDMDHDDLELMKQSVTTITSDEEYDCNNMNNNNLKGISSSQGNTDEDDEDYDNFELFDYNTSAVIPIGSSRRHSSAKASSSFSLKMPSLVDSSIKSAKSWCDLDDEEGFDFELGFEESFRQMSVQNQRSMNKLNKLSNLNVPNCLHRDSKEASSKATLDAIAAASTVTTANSTTSTNSTAAAGTTTTPTLAMNETKSKTDDSIRVIERELLMDNTARTINWFEF